MYNLYEIAFMLMYFGGLAVASSIGMLLVQGIVYRVTGFSIYKAVMRMADKIIKEEF